jgi:hypothetical protein
VNRIVLMLQEIGAGGVRETVHRRGFPAGRPGGFGAGRSMVFER